MEKNRLRIYYYGYHRKWPELLRQARGIPVEEYNFFLVHYVNRALFHTGKLGCEMFSYPQTSGGRIVMWQGRARFVNIGLRFELGLVNDAEQLAHESLELFDGHPMTLKQLALINIAKGQTDTACIFHRSSIAIAYRTPYQGFKGQSPFKNSPSSFFLILLKVFTLQ